MTTRDGDTVTIAPEPKSICEDCGARAETRPYGPNGQRICFPCGMKDPKGTEERAAHLRWGGIDA
jgi:hypothetical protein